MSTVLDPIKMWEDLHKIPELAMQEVKTAAYVTKTLQDLGIEVQTGIGGTTGVMGIIKGSEPGPVVMLRADMDALPFTIDGKECAIHACGHDSHTAMLLAAASRLKDRVKKGTLKLLFQPAEEEISGALAMIKAGVIDDVDYALGAHIRPIQDVPAGQICPAVNHTASNTLRVEVTGRSAHAARPHLGVNALDVACAIVQGTQNMWFNPTNIWSMKATQLHADQGATNSIPEKAVITFDCRAQTNPLMKDFRERFAKLVEGIATGYGATATISELGACPAAEYDDDLKQMVIESIVRTHGQEAVAKDCGGGGEDFHYYKMHKPTMKAAYFGLGVGATPGLHAATMHFDPKYLPMGVDVMVDVVERLIG